MSFILNADLYSMQEYVRTVNVEHGWYDIERPISADVALLHSEVSEAYEAYRKGRMFEKHEGQYDPSSFPAELADILIRLLDTADRAEVDLYKAFLAKMKYNEGRSYRHGGKAE